MPDPQLLSLMLFSTGSWPTGRTPLDTPVEELTEQELIDFWADDTLGEPVEWPVASRRRGCRVGPGHAYMGRE